MDKSKFDVVFPIMCSDLVKRISIELNISDNEAITKLYSSNLYKAMEQEETKVWQYSTEKLFELFSEEIETGIINFPEI